MNTVQNAPEPPFVAPARWEAILPIAFAICVDLIFDWLGQTDRGTIAGAFTLAFICSLRMSWRLRRATWFWITFATLSALHVAVLALPWSGASKWNGSMLIPFATADLIVVMAVIYLVYRQVRGRPEQLFADELRP